MKKEPITEGTLKEGEFHPSAVSALKFIQGLTIVELNMWQETFSSVDLSGNRLAEVCSETLARIREGKAVSDRYLLGLAWCIERGVKNLQ